MRYVALLRGINVGGKTRVEMPKLKMAFEKIGCDEVTTYINSGNVIFSDSRTARQLEEIIETVVEKEFGFHVPVVIRDESNIKMLCAKIPVGWTNDKQQKTDVLFLWEPIDNRHILDKVVINPELENVLYRPGALVWNIGRENVTRGSGIKLVKTDIYKYMTVRNINTVRKIADLMSSS